MKQPPRSHRRDFLVGRAAAKAAEAIGQRNEAADGDATEPNVTAQEDQFLLEFSRKAMACNFEVLLPPEGTEIGPERAVEALDFLDEIEDCWSVYRDHSLMSRVNRLAAEHPVAVDDDLFSLLRLPLLT